MAENIIETYDLTFYYGKKKVVDGLNLRVQSGSVFALLGRNGSGKTTTIRMLLGLLYPTRGFSKILGHDSEDIPPGVLSSIGYMNEEHKVYRWMKVREIEKFQSQFYPLWKRELFYTVIEHFRLDTELKVKHLSRGQRAGLCLALTMAQNPKLLILDDPVLGLDAVVRRTLMEAMVYLTRDSDKTILFSSHILSEVERVADRIAIIDNGVLRANCSVDTFRERVNKVSLYFESPPLKIPDIKNLLNYTILKDRINFTFVNYDDEIENVLKNLNPQNIEPVPLSLEDAFINYVEDKGKNSFLINRLGEIS